MRYPLDKIFVTQHFGENTDLYRPFNLAGHNGVDFRTRFVDSLGGVRPCFAVSDGTVIEVGDQGKRGYGKFVRIQHVGTSQSVYGHFSKVLAVEGQIVQEGEIIGYTGNTGFSSGPHLHFGLRPDGWSKIASNGFAGYVDPIPYLEGEKTLLTPKFDPGFADKWAGWLIIVTDRGGETWYISPKTKKRYRLSRSVTPADAQILARDQAWVGMKHDDLLKIEEAV